MKVDPMVDEWKWHIRNTLLLFDGVGWRKRFHLVSESIQTKFLSIEMKSIHYKEAAVVSISKGQSQR